MDFMNFLLNLFVPPASMITLAFSWPALCFLNLCEWLYNNIYGEDMDCKVVIITGASSGIGEQIAYEYAIRRANLMLVARREQRLIGIAENARRMGARHVMIMAADVVKEDDCRRFVTQTINVFGRLDHLVNTVSLGHTFYFQEVTDTSVFPVLLDINFWGNIYPTLVALPYLHQSNGRVIINASVESWLPLPRMSLYGAAKAALINFYETLRFELKDEVGVTIATHGWIGSEMTRGKFMMEEGAEMQWKEEREGLCSKCSQLGIPLAYFPTGDQKNFFLYRNRKILGHCGGKQTRDDDDVRGNLILPQTQTLTLTLTLTPPVSHLPSLASCSKR